MADCRCVKAKAKLFSLPLVSFSNNTKAEAVSWLQRDAVCDNSRCQWSLTMDGDVDPDDENVNSVLAQETLELCHILSGQPPTVIGELCQMMPSGSAWDISDQPVAATVKAMLEYFSEANAADCRNFLQSMCLLCENIPMRLESRLMSVAGYANNVCENPSPGVTKEEPPSPRSELQLVKRPRIDHWEHYIGAVTRSLLRRWERLSGALVKEVQLENVWVNPRTANRGRDRPDQTPGPTDRGSRTPEPDGDFGSLESRVTLETFLQGCAGKVTVVAGPAGSGKTLLMSCLGQQWAHGLGPVPSSYLFVLLEFRLLNLLSSPLSLSELLFRHYLPPKGEDDDDVKRAIVDYLLSNPAQSCWVLDGYDEFYSKLSGPEVQGERLDPEKPLPVADLISGLLNRQLLPGCTVLVTCRVRDVMDLEGVSDKVGQLLGWDSQEIKDYVDDFFGVKGDSANRAFGGQAADLLLSSQHLLAMSCLPALCNICCICLKHLLLEEKEGGAKVQDRGGETRGKDAEKKPEGVQIAGERKESGEDLITDGTNGRTQVQIPSTLTPVQIPSTLTQVQTPSTLSQVQIPSTLSQVQIPSTLSQVQIPSTLSQVQIPSTLSQVQIPSTLTLVQIPSTLTQVQKPSTLSQVQTPSTLSQVQIPSTLTLVQIPSTLTQVQIPSTLSQVQIPSTLSQVQIPSTLTPVQIPSTLTQVQIPSTLSQVQIPSTLSQVYLNVLCAFLSRNSAKGGKTGKAKTSKPPHRPSTLSWYRSEICELSQLAWRGLEKSKILFLEEDIPRSVLDFSIRTGLLSQVELRLESGTLARAYCFIHLTVQEFLAALRIMTSADVSDAQLKKSFRSRKYGDKFAEKLSSVLPEFSTLRKLEFCGSSLTATGAASLASALEKCPEITEINLSDNSLKDEGIKHVADIFAKLPRLASVMVSRNNSSLTTVDYLVGKMSSCFNIQRVHADAMKEVTVTFSQNSDMDSHHKKSEPSVSLLNQKWNKPEMQKVVKSLARCPALSVLDLSGGQWDVEVLKTLTQFLPKFNVTEKIILNDSCSSVDDLVVLTALLSKHPAVVELHIRLQSSPDPVPVSIVFSGGSKRPANTKTLCLGCCGLLHTGLTRVLRSLGTSCDLAVLDLSSNCLGNNGLKKLLDVLPHLGNIREIDASDNGISVEGVTMLAGALCSCDNLTEIHIRDGGREQVILKFCSGGSDDKEQLKMFRMNNSSLLPAHITALCMRLVRCRSPLELDLSHSSLKDKAVESLLRVLPKMASLQRLNVSHSVTSTAAALILARCLTVSRRVTSVELRPQSECFVLFDRGKAEQASCRLTHYSLNSDNVERLTEILLQGPELSDLDLSSNRLEDEGVKRLVDSLPRLKINSFVNLSNNSLTQRGLLDVAGTLVTCDDVSGVEVSVGAGERCLIWFRQNDGRCEKTLSVKGSSLESDHLVRLAAIVSNCPSLTKLEFKNNSLQSEWIEDFVKALDVGQTGCSVSIDECWIRAEKAVSLVCRCLEVSSNIQTIRVDHTTLHLFLMKSTGLTSVSLVDCALEGRQLSPVKSIIQRRPSLTELDFSHNSLGAAGAESLCSVLPLLPELSSLSVVSKETCETVVEKLSQALLQSATVQCLNLSGHVISDAAAQTMTAILPRLRSLNLSHCSWSAAAGLQLVRALGRCVRLEVLCLDCVHLDENSRACLAQALRKIRSIRSLKLNEIAAAVEPSEANGVLDLLAAMEELTRIEELELDGWRMSGGGVEQLSRLLPVWTELRKISLSKNLISDQSGDKLLEALTSCGHLEELSLCSNQLGDLTAARMALVLPSMTHITALDVSENAVGSEGSESLSRAMKCMKKLSRIQLTSVGTSELCAVAASLAHCPLIRDVGLGWNNCGDEVVLELARVLPVCQKLTRIDLESNSVSVVGVEALLRALQSCPALELIRLWRNDVSSSDAQRLSLKDGRLNFSST
ncbi:NLR family, CARD domain containing 5 isoform X5 [Scophthalmus maximus]|uniref:NLR family, CARD domain containing 5 isoform X5 n=1 Tax=Scophthalmus maximus TaxID=52904 RepID=UPI001FA851FC|nr:NLR family, CARD domain containing 5 isoform X5 [Scophthalmus maximus]